MLEALEAEERRSRQAASAQLQQQQQQADQGMSLRGGRVLSTAQAQGAAAAAALASRLEQWVASPTLVERVFGGRLASAIVCCSCGFESVSGATGDAAGVPEAGRGASCVWAAWFGQQAGFGACALITIWMVHAFLNAPQCLCLACL